MIIVEKDGRQFEAMGMAGLVTTPDRIGIMAHLRDLETDEVFTDWAGDYNVIKKEES